LWTMYKHAYPTEEEKVRSGVQEAIHADQLKEAEKGGKHSSSVHVKGSISVNSDH
jgi:hypothetical protein